MIMIKKQIIEYDDFKFNHMNNKIQLLHMWFYPADIMFYLNVEHLTENTTYI